MRVVLFCHSLISDWNHGNAHFLRGIALELMARGHEVVAYEAADAWSKVQMLADAGPAAVDGFRHAFPSLQVREFRPPLPPLDEALEGADLVLVHEWNDPTLVQEIGRHRAGRGRYVLLFHDTHHRSVSDADSIEQLDLSGYDGVLAFGEGIRQRYLTLGWSHRVWTWHEAADVRTFTPRRCNGDQGDLVWIGNWGDDERSSEFYSYLIEPARRLGLMATVHGVRYPEAARRALALAGIRYGGWLANYAAPETYARHRVTVHIPRQPYVTALPGIPTIRVFEALACGIPLVCSYWDDVEHLFTAGRDFLLARSPAAMEHHLRAVLCDAALSQSLVEQGLATIRARHTCAHRVDALLAIMADVRGIPAEETLLA
jgi:spore maturation protein CgeB